MKYIKKKKINNKCHTGWEPKSVWFESIRRKSKLFFSSVLETYCLSYCGTAPVLCNLVRIWSKAWSFLSMSDIFSKVASNRFSSRFVLYQKSHDSFVIGLFQKKSPCWGYKSMENYREGLSKRVKFQGVDAKIGKYLEFPEGLLSIRNPGWGSNSKNSISST